MDTAFDLMSVLEPFRDKRIAVALHDLETDAEYFQSADEEFHPASTFKVHVMMEVFRQAHEGMLSLAETQPIINSFDVRSIMPLIESDKNRQPGLRLAI